MAARGRWDREQALNPLTSSEMAAFLNCRRGWFITFYLRLRRARMMPSLPNIGSMYHRALEAYYNEEARGLGDAIRQEALDLMEKHPDFGDDIAKDAEWAAIMAEGYVEWVEETGADEGLRVIGAEQAVEVDLGDTGLKLRGKIDTRLERESDGAWLQLEHKTVGDFKTLPSYAQSAPQFLTYDLLAFLKAKEDGGRATDGVILNMARRVKRTKTAKPPFYQRHEVRHSTEELRAHWRHVVAIGREIERTRERLDAGEDHHEVCLPNVTRNHTWSCACNDLGAMMDDGSDWRLYVEELYEPFDPWERYAPKEAEE